MGHQWRYSLHAEHLGKINLNVATRNGVITATITAQNESVKAAIENQVIQLKESMNNQGLKVENVEATVASHEFNMNYDNNGDSQNMGNGTNNSSRRFRTEEELAYLFPANLLVQLRIAKVKRLHKPWTSSTLCYNSLIAVIIRR